MTGSILPKAKSQFTDNNGNPLSGGSVYFYIPSTSTFKNTYQDEAQTILNTNPVTLDARGECVVWGTGDYRQVVYDRNNILVWDQVTSGPASGADLNNFINLIEGNTGFGVIGRCADVSALRLTNPTTADQIIETVEHTVGGKLGGNRFYYDITDNSTMDDDGSCIVTNSGKRWKLINKTQFVSPFDFGAKGDGSTDDYLCFVNALKLNNVISINHGYTFAISQGITLSNEQSLVGYGNLSQIKAISAMPYLVSVVGNSAYGNRGSYAISGVRLDGNNLAQTCLYVGSASSPSGAVVKRVFEKSTLYNALGNTLVVDAAQNCNFVSLECGSDSNTVVSTRSLYLINGAGNNNFIGCEFNAASLNNIRIDTDNTYPGYALNIFGGVPTLNLFIGCVIENIGYTASSILRAVYILNASRTYFFGGDIDGATCSSEAVYISATSPLTKFFGTAFTSGAILSIPFLSNDGFETYLINVDTENYNGTYHIYTSSIVHLTNVYAGGENVRVQNTAGDQATNIKTNNGLRYSSLTDASSINAAFLPSEMVFNASDELYMRGKLDTQQIVTGFNKFTNQPQPSSANPSMTFQLPEFGVYSVSFTVESSDYNHIRQGIFNVAWRTSTVNNLTGAGLLGSQLVSGSNISGISVSVDVTGLLTLAATLGAASATVFKFRITEINTL